MSAINKGEVLCPLIYNDIGNHYEVINPNIQNCVFIIDKDDYEKVYGYWWGNVSNGYIGAKGMALHRFLTNCPKGLEVDHKNGNKLDNRKENLRICSRKENSRNAKISKRNTSGYKGVRWAKNEKKWVAGIIFNGKNVHLGYFTCKHEAAREYNKAAVKYFREFAWLNAV